MPSILVRPCTPSTITSTPGARASGRSGVEPPRGIRASDTLVRIRSSTAVLCLAAA